jgi:hypothetical protein
MDWYAAEPIVAADPAWAAEALAACKIPKVSEFIARRMSEKWAASGRRASGSAGRRRYPAHEEDTQGAKRRTANRWLKLS